MPEKLLVVDDESHVRESTMRLLQKKGYEVEGASSGAEALTRLRAKSYDLILLDIRMPGMSGLELLRQAKAINPELMALFMTGYGTVENAIEAIELGALGFVRKPVPIDELIKTIDEALAKERLKRENVKLRALMPLFELSKVFLSELDENKILGLVLDTVMSETKADIAQILLKDEGGNLVKRSSRGLPITDEMDRVVAHAMAANAVSTLKPVVAYRKDGNILKSPEEIQQQTSCDIYVPFIIRGEAIGVLRATRMGNGTSYKQSDIEFLSTLCGQGAIAIHNARLFESVQRKQAEVEELLTRVLNTTENERLKLSLELHDGPVQSIVAAQYGAEACKSLLGKNELAKVDTKLESIQKMLTLSVHDLRRIVRDLHPPALGTSGLASAVEEYLSNLEKDAGISGHLELKGTTVNLEPSMERGVYYVVREALTNVRKHASAADVSVVIEFKENNLEITVADNGKGFDLAARDSSPDNGHIGLKGMRERIKMMNGDLTIESKPGSGTTVKLNVPIKKSKPDEAVSTDQIINKQGGDQQ